MFLFHSGDYVEDFATLTRRYLISVQESNESSFRSCYNIHYTPFNALLDVDRHRNFIDDINDLVR